MTRAMLAQAADLTKKLLSETVIDFHEIGSEGAVLRTVVPGPIRGPGSWLIARDGSACSYEGEIRKPIDHND